MGQEGLTLVFSKSNCIVNSDDLGDLSQVSVKFRNALESRVSTNMSISSNDYPNSNQLKRDKTLQFNYNKSFSENLYRAFQGKLHFIKSAKFRIDMIHNFPLDFFHQMNHLTKIHFNSMNITSSSLLHALKPLSNLRDLLIIKVQFKNDQCDIGFNLPQSLRSLVVFGWYCKHRIPQNIVDVLNTHSGLEHILIPSNEFMGKFLTHYSTIRHLQLDSWEEQSHDDWKNIFLNNRQIKIFSIATKYLNQEKMDIAMGSNYIQHLHFFRGDIVNKPMQLCRNHSIHTITIDIEVGDEFFKSVCLQCVNLAELSLKFNADNDICFTIMMCPLLRKVKVKDVMQADLTDIINGNTHLEEIILTKGRSQEEARLYTSQVQTTVIYMWMIKNGKLCIYPDRLIS